MKNGQRHIFSTRNSQEMFATHIASTKLFAKYVPHHAANPFALKSYDLTPEISLHTARLYLQ